MYSRAGPPHLPSRRLRSQRRSWQHFKRVFRGGRDTLSVSDKNSSFSFYCCGVNKYDLSRLWLQTFPSCSIFAVISVTRAGQTQRDMSMTTQNTDQAPLTAGCTCNDKVSLMCLICNSFKDTEKGQIAFFTNMGPHCQYIVNKLKMMNDDK